MTSRITAPVADRRVGAHLHARHARHQRQRHLDQEPPLPRAVGGALGAVGPRDGGDDPRGHQDSIVTRSDLDLDDYADTLDGLVLQGGNDVAPETYGETPLHPDWAGDRVRDRYEIELIDAFVRAGKPVFGICRGLQLLNVMFGGTLLQDIATQRPASRAHRDGSAFERHFHGDRAGQGLAPGAAVPGRAQGHGQQPAPPGDQGPGAGLRGRGVLPRRRHDRGGAPRRPGLRGRRCSGTPSSTFPATRTTSTTRRCCATS